METTELYEAYQAALLNAGVPKNLANQCAEILTKDDPEKNNLGRSESGQHLIKSSLTWMKANGFFEK